MADRTVLPTTAHQSSLGLGASVLAAVGWGLAGILATLTSAPGLVITFYRMWLGVVLLILIVRLSGRRVTWALIRACTAGGLLLCADMSFFFSAIKLTTVAVATVIGALQPALVMVAAGPMLGERVSRARIGWTAIAISGVVTIVLGAGVPSGQQLSGDLLAVGALFAWSAYFIASKRARSRLDALDYTAGVTIVGAVAVTAVVLVSGESLTNVRIGDGLWIGLLAVVPGSAHLLMNWAHRHLAVSVSSVVGSASPIVAAIGGVIILNQPLSFIQVVGGIIGVAAISVVAAHRIDDPVKR